MIRMKRIFFDFLSFFITIYFEHLYDLLLLILIFLFLGHGKLDREP